MKKYKLGFSFKGLLAFAIIMIPNIIWMINPPDNDFLSDNSSSIGFLNILMTASQWLMIMLLVLLVRRDKPKEKLYGYKICCLSCVIVYYFFWVLYFMNIFNPVQLIGMAVFPCVFFISFILCEKQFPALIPAIIFSLLHIGITTFNVLTAL